MPFFHILLCIGFICCTLKRCLYVPMQALDGFLNFVLTSFTNWWCDIGTWMLAFFSPMPRLAFGIEKRSRSPNRCLSAFSLRYSAGPGPRQLSCADSVSCAYNLFLASLVTCIMKFWFACAGPPILLPMWMPIIAAGLRLLEVLSCLLSVWEKMVFISLYW